MSKYETSRTLEELRHSYSHDPSTVHNPSSTAFIGAVPCNLSHSPRRPLKERLDRAFFTRPGLRQHLVGYHGVPWGKRWQYQDEAELQYKVAKVKANNRESAAGAWVPEVKKTSRLFSTPDVYKKAVGKNRFVATIKKRWARIRARRANKT